MSDTEERHPKVSGPQALCCPHSSAFLPESALSPGFCEQHRGLLLLPLHPGRQWAVPFLLRLPGSPPASPQSEGNGVALLAWASGRGPIHTWCLHSGEGVEWMLGGMSSTMWNLSPERLRVSHWLG